METPSSTSRRVTRSQALAAGNNLPVSRKIEETEKSVQKSRQRKQQDRSALFDISNDSPIVGLAKGSVETPSSGIVKQKMSRAKSTPGSGEALLRGQVKTLLQKVEEEAEISKLTPDTRQFVHLQGFAKSPMGLLAPTPANTPYISDLSGDSDITIASPVVEQRSIAQEESAEREKNVITRSLLLDFSDSPDQVKGDVDVDALCEGMNHMSVKEAVKFEGKHTRFVYDSDDELMEDGVLRLKGLPTPKGKHLRFQDQDE